MRIKDNTTLAAGKMSETPEGFLLCRDVVLARTGQQDYGYWEVPTKLRDMKNARGLVTIHRHEDDVFHPDTIESFRGKAMTDDHPMDDVGPANYHQLLKGVIQNPRRGDGPNKDHLVGDILVYDAGVIKKIRAGKREVSCGYDAAYEVADGRAYQRNIRGNHVSLVDAGRCGAACCIKDSGAAASQEKLRMALKKSTFMDALRGVFKAKDDDTREAAMSALEKELPDEDDNEGDGEDKGGESEGDKANHHHVTVNIGGSMQGAEGDKAKDRRARDADDDTTDDDTEGDEDNSMAEGLTKEDVAEAVTAAVKAATEPLIARIEELESAVEDVADPDDDMTQDSVARAEVLMPGFTLPAFDAKPGSKAHRDALVGMQRRVLSQAYATRDGMSVIRPLVASARPDFARMPVGELGVVFRGASAALASANNARQTPQHMAMIKDSEGKRGPLTQDAWNGANKDFWKKGASA